MGETLSRNSLHCATDTQASNADGSTSPFKNGCIRVTVFRRHDPKRRQRRRAKSYENIFKRETDFFCRTIRQPADLGSRLLAKNCLSFDDLTKIEAEDSIGDQTHVLVEIVTKKDCFVQFYEILLEDESPLVDYLEIKRNSTKYISDAEFVKKLGMKAFLTETDRQILKKYYRYIIKNTTNADDIFTHLFQEGIIDDETLEKLDHMALDSAKMKYFVQTTVSRWTYAEMKAFCTILMEENSHVAKVLWPIVFTVDPTLRTDMAEAVAMDGADTDLPVETDTRHENIALKVFKDSKIHRQTSVVLGNHGDVTSVEAGSIKVTITVKTVADFQQLLNDIETGCIQHRFKQWIISHDKHFDHACAVRADVTAAERATVRGQLEQHTRLFSEAETLKERVQFGFCKERGQWFWSPDSFIWIHVSRLLVPSGVEKNKVPNADDIATIQFLAKQQIRVQYPVSPCPVCTMGKFTVENENIYEQLRYSESLHRGVPVTVTFRVCKASLHRLTKSTANILRKKPPKLKIPPHVGDTQDYTFDANNRSVSEPCTPTIKLSRHSDLVYGNVSVKSLTMSRETIL